MLKILQRGWALRLSWFALAVVLWPGLASAQSDATAPTPLVQAGMPTDWLFVFKFNGSAFSSKDIADRPCPFGGTAQPYKLFGQQYVFATNANPTLVQGAGLLGTSDNDPVGATFGEIYNSSLHYVVWNDQPYGHPHITGCGENCEIPWGHSKGVLAWNEAGEGLVLQVSTPSWPLAGRKDHPRIGDGNTLGCVQFKNDVAVNQHLFALRLTRSDVAAVLAALVNASVGTDIHNAGLTDNGGPPEIQALVQQLGVRSSSVKPTMATLSSGIRLISKPSNLNVPPWQMVSALLGGIDMRVANWWTVPKIYSTDSASRIDCWDPSLPKPGGVEIALHGHWQNKTFGLSGIPTNGNHAKIGVSTAPASSITVFGDENQQGALTGKCASSQNGRGGLFFVVDNAPLHAAVSDLIAGDTAPLSPAQ